MRFTLTAAALSLFLAGALQAADTPVAQTIPKPYPLKTCLVSGATLGEMGDPVVKIYDGQEIKFCCGGCTKSFEKDSAKFLADMNKQVAALSPTGGKSAARKADPAAKTGMGTGMGMGCCK